MSGRYTSVVDVFMLLERHDGRILLLERAADTYAAGLLGPAAVILENGESLVAAAARAAWETAGVRIDTGHVRFAHVIHHNGPDGESRVGVVFLACRWEGEPYVRQPSRHSLLAWADPADPPATCIPHTAAVLAGIASGSPFSLDGWPAGGEPVASDAEREPLAGVDPELVAYLAGHPAPLVCVDALIRDERGRLLVVDPVYKPGWDTPGGLLEDEELLVGLYREVAEELQLAVTAGRLLAVDNLSGALYGRSLIAFLYEVTVPDPAAIGALVLQREEIREAAFLPEAEALERLPEGLRRRVAAGLRAARGSHTAHLLNGLPVAMSRGDQLAVAPAPLSAVSVLVRDAQGRVLVVETLHDVMRLPGCLVLAHESPRLAARRQLAEALNLPDVAVGRLLVLHNAPAHPGRRAQQTHVFDVGPLTEQQTARVDGAGPQVLAARWLEPEAALARLPEATRVQVQAGLHALATGGIAELEHGFAAAIGASVAAAEAELG